MTEWNDASVAKLRALWAEGLSTAEVGRRLGVSKNAAVGKAHRLHLPARPSPIRAPLEVRPFRRRSDRRKVALPALASLAVPPPVAAVERPPAAEKPPLGALPPGRGARVIECCWPLGEPGTKAFRFCDEPSEPGRPYCADHCHKAYVKTETRRTYAAGGE